MISHENLHLCQRLEEYPSTCAGVSEDLVSPGFSFYERPLCWEYLKWQKHCFIHKGKDSGQP